MEGGLGLSALVLRGTEKGPLNTPDFASTHWLMLRVWTDPWEGGVPLSVGFIYSWGGLERKGAQIRTEFEETKTRTQKSNFTLSTPHLIFPSLDSISQEMQTPWRESGTGTQRVGQGLSSSPNPV